MRTFAHILPASTHLTTVHSHLNDSWIMQGGAPQVKIDLQTHLTMDISSRSSEQTYLYVAQ
jgi:hypothetical protein